MDSDRPDSKWMKVFIPWTMVKEYSIEPPPGWIPNRSVTDYWDKYKFITPAQAYWLQTSGLPKCNRNMEKFKQEYPINDVECWAMTGDAVYDQNILRQMLQEIDGGTGVSVITDPWVVFEDPKPEDQYVIFCDPAGSWADRDNFGVIILNLNTCEQAAEYVGHISAYQMAQRLAEWGRKYNDAMVYVESNGVGESVLSHLVDNPNIAYRRVYHRPASRYGRSKRRIAGWFSNTKTKKEAEGFMQQLIEDESVTIHSVRSLRQLMSYRGTWGSRSRDQEGGHYDLASAWAGAAWAYMQRRGSQWRSRRKDPKQLAAEAMLRLQRRIDASANQGANTPWGKHV
jgi:hypothetical protein